MTTLITIIGIVLTLIFLIGAIDVAKSAWKELQDNLNGKKGHA